ncbi:MAG: hypothetical protein MSA07_00925 [Mucispirillum sp.]|uniref:Outer membrane protein beta-barrel domain-containing protein n=1 Tax=Candidatus Mucispirillum faecigallinarum TaxID=2838699 RepID=A0A9D2GVI0_9BACT|nr:hypothetical protein [Mucispirillum sp.]HIZ90016.1 hypothetical protein [Candidatus Mucispirillum faecigallinarum]
MKSKFYLILVFILTGNICFAQVVTDNNTYTVDNQQNIITEYNEKDNSSYFQNKIMDNNTANDITLSKDYTQEPMTLTLILNGFFPMNTPEEKTGFGGGFRYKYSFLKYFALATSLEYTSIGFLTNHYVDVKAHFLVQRNLPVNKSGFVPYIGIGPSFRTNVSSGTSVMGYSVTAGTQYVWKYLVTGFGIDYSSFPNFQAAAQSNYSTDIKVFFEIGARF